jgi:Sugar (and other) transporter
MFSRATARPLALLLALFFFQQFCGMNAVVFYAVRMFQAEGGRTEEGGLDEHQAAVVVAATRLVVMCVACALLTRCGRRPVALLSGLGMAAAMIFLGVLVFVQGAPSLPVVLACVAAFIASNTFGKCAKFLNSGKFYISFRIFFFFKHGYEMPVKIEKILNDHNFQIFSKSQL